MGSHIKYNKQNRYIISDKKYIKQKVTSCRFSLRPSLGKPLPSKSSHLIPSRTWRPRFRIRKAFHQISRGSSSPENSLRTEEPSPITTSRRNQLFTWFSDLEEECKFSSRPSLERPSPSRLSPAIPSRTSRPRSKTRREFPQTSRD